jgi:hypothetical protein
MEEHRLKVFQQRELWRRYVHKKKEITGGLRRLHREVLFNIYGLANIIRVIKSRKIRWLMPERMIITSCPE